ncbi:hypothetical protein TREMEDRAFT_64848 [Tremella mesenterica DSM 1558]|uniref:uncharacterized protein n=1 Tax=Tremella mesenterica (strain ATCC 24925 / CBS 8224 / DSM 1558 / NBRC 9311 / NRRL Y-6157 / RJB 2259-6 / UBC 559-6) TaxID=578456 RepID=UPI0003F4954F|nr:uncharacterized protein TREMEDRAFT_64848 [Tremella mesenterica DSM 1558]EIW66986.1 hypothetical protein TREMEDRAFT_64848 [Tremella mesenterica DSM 1558]
MDNLINNDFSIDFSIKTAIGRVGIAGQTLPFPHLQTIDSVRQFGDLMETLFEGGVELRDCIQDYKTLINQDEPEEEIKTFLRKLEAAMNLIISLCTILRSTYVGVSRSFIETLANSTQSNPNHTNDQDEAQQVHTEQTVEPDLAAWTVRRWNQVEASVNSLAQMMVEVRYW